MVGRVRKMWTGVHRPLKKCQNFKNKFFHEFFRYLHVSNGGWKYIPWKCFGHHIMVRKLVWQKRPIIFDPPQIYPLFYWTFELHSIFSHLWSTRQCWPKFLCDKKAPIVPYTTLTSEFSYLTWFLRYLHFHVRIRLDRILK